MFSRRTLASFVVVLAAAAALPALSAGVKYTPDAFATAQKSGNPILVEITAPWCPTCKAQKAVMSQLETMAKYRAITRVEVDFDSQKDAVKSFGATMQSTMIVYRGAKEVGRLVGDAKRESIEMLLSKAL